MFVALAWLLRVVTGLTVVRMEKNKFHRGSFALGLLCGFCVCNFIHLEQQLAFPRVDVGIFSLFYNLTVTKRAGYGCNATFPLTIVYSGPTTKRTAKADQYYENIKFFIERGLPCRPCENHVNIIFVFTEESVNSYRDQLISLNATCHGNIHIMLRKDRCYDMEAARVALSHHSMLPGERVIFLNCGMLGPFSSSLSPYWGNTFANMINDEVKLSGVSINCGGKLGVDNPHIQSMLWCTDEVGLKAIFSDGNVYHCKNQLSERDGRAKLIVRYELGMSRTIMQGGNKTWKIQALLGNTKYGWSEVNAKCEDRWNDPHLIKKYLRNLCISGKLQDPNRNNLLYRSFVKSLI